MEGLSVTLHELKMASVRLLCYFCCLPSHLYREHQRLLSLPRADAAAVAAGHLNKALGSAEEILVLVPQIVLDTVRSNDDQELLMSCMWLGFVFVLETLDVPQCASFPAQYVNLVLNRTVATTSGWDVHSISTGLKILTHLAEYQNTAALCQGDLASSVVVNLCKLIESHCTIEYRKEYSDEVIVTAMEAVVAWIVNDTQALTTKDTKLHVWNKIFEALNIAAYARLISSEGTAATQKYVVPSPKVKEAAECTIEHLLCKTSHFPAPSVPFQEADYLEKENLTIKNASCYVAGSTIISLITHPKNEANATIKIAAFVRSISGKFFWESEIHTSAYDNIFAYNANKPAYQHQTHPASQPPSKHEDQSAVISQKLKNCFATTQQQALFNSLIDIAQKQEQKKVDNGHPKPNPTHHKQAHPSQPPQPQPAPQLSPPSQTSLLQPPQPTQPQAKNPSATPLSPQLLRGGRMLTPLSVRMASQENNNNNNTGMQDLTAVRIFLSNLGFISQPPMLAPSLPSSPIMRHKNISHNAPTASAYATPSFATGPLASGGAGLLPSQIPSHSSPCSIFSHSNFRVIELPNVNIFDYMFGLLDEIRERECYEISVLYVPAKFPFSEPDAVFDINEGSTKFEDFVQSIGWKVRLADHKGYAGQVGIGLPVDSTECSIYYANNTLEVMYRVSTYLARYRKMAMSLASLSECEPADEPAPPSGSLSARPHHSFMNNNSNNGADNNRFFDIDEFQPGRPGTPSNGDGAKASDSFKTNKRGSFKKSMSVSGGMGFSTIPNRDVLQSGPAIPTRPPAQSVFRKSIPKTSFADEENINSLASRKKLLTTPKVLILWSDATRSLQEGGSNMKHAGNISLPQWIGSRALISIIIFPLKSGLFHIRIVKKPSILLGPLVDDIVVSFQLLPQLVRLTAINACRALNDPDSPKPGVVRKNLLEEFAKPGKEVSFYHFYSPHFSAPNK